MAGEDLSKIKILEEIVKGKIDLIGSNFCILGRSLNNEKIFLFA